MSPLTDDLFLISYRAGLSRGPASCLYCCFSCLLVPNCAGAAPLDGRAGGAGILPLRRGVVLGEGRLLDSQVCMACVHASIGVNSVHACIRERMGGRLAVIGWVDTGWIMWHAHAVCLQPSSRDTIHHCSRRVACDSLGFACMY